MKKSGLPKLLFSISLAATLSSFGATATDMLGASDSGTVNVSITIPALTYISSLSNITVTVPADTDLGASGFTAACVYSNVRTPAAGNYFITAQSQKGTATQFTAKNTATPTPDAINYTATWYPSSNNATGTSVTLQSAVKSGPYTGNTTSVNCGSTTNVSFKVSFTGPNLQGVPPGTYTDQVTLTVSPT